MHDFIKSEVKKVWNELYDESSPHYFEFVKMFHHLNPTKTLMILAEMIDQQSEITIDVNGKDSSYSCRYPHMSDDIVDLLGEFADTDDLSAALDLFFQYFLKRPDLYDAFHRTVDYNFTIQRNSQNNGCVTQILFLKKLKEYSDNWKQKTITLLFLETANEFINLKHYSAESNQKSAILHNISLSLSDGVKEYRSLVWKYLLQLCNIEEYRDRVREILRSYISDINSNLDILQFDLQHIKSIMNVAFTHTSLENCIFVDYLCQIIDDQKLRCRSLFSEYFTNEKFKIYMILKGPNCDPSQDSVKNNTLKEQRIAQYLNCDIVKFRQLVDICCEVSTYQYVFNEEIATGLVMAFEQMAHNNDQYVAAIEYYIEKNTPYDICPCYLVNTLFKTSLTDDDILNMINKHDFVQKNEWLDAYYHELPEPYIDGDNLCGLYEYIDNFDDDLKTIYSHDLEFLEKYRSMDKDIFIKICRYIFNKVERSPQMVKSYFRLMFNSPGASPQKLVHKFREDMELLEKIYIFMLSCNPAHDCSGAYLLEIYRRSPTILPKYISCLLHGDRASSISHQKRHLCFYNLENFIEIYDSILDGLIAMSQHPTLTVPSHLESFTSSKSVGSKRINKRDEWISHCIQSHANDPIKMYCIFRVISELDDSRRKEYIQKYLANNNSVEDFKTLQLLPNSGNCFVDVEKTYLSKIKFLKSLLPNFIGIKWLKHKQYVESLIDDLEACLNEERLREFYIKSISDARNGYT